MLFSVIIPVYNGGTLLADCMDSVLGQRMTCVEAKTDEDPVVEMEIILVDDGSTDGSGELCDQYAAKDARIRVIHQENRGQPRARQAGIFASAGDYICYVDADDTVRPDWLETIAACIRKGNEPDLLVFGIEEHYESSSNNIICELHEGLYDEARLKKEVFPYVISDRRKYFTSQIIFPVPWDMVYRRELLVKHHNREERLRWNEDAAFVFECVLNARSIYITHRILYDYKRNVPFSSSAKFGGRLTENDVYLSYYLRSRLSGLGVDGQINDYVFSGIIRSILWKADNLPFEEAKDALGKELAATKLLEHVRLRGLPPVPALFFIALRLRMYGPILKLANIKNRAVRAGKSRAGKSRAGKSNTGKSMTSKSSAGNKRYYNLDNNNGCNNENSGNNENCNNNRDRPGGSNGGNVNSEDSVNNRDRPGDSNGNIESGGSECPRLSFVVPVYRTEKYLPRCIESILSQTMPDIELILVDDGSPDACPEICEAYAAADRRVKVLHQKNAGVVRARNEGIDIAKGEYIMLVDSDDYVSPRLAGVIVDAMEKRSRPDLILFPYNSLLPDHVVESSPMPPAGFYSRRRIEAELLPYFISDRRKKWLTPGIPVTLFCKAFRRDYLMAHRFGKEGIKVGEDAAQSFECVFYARSLFICRETLYFYDRTNEASVTSIYRSDLPEITTALISWLEQAIGGKNQVVDRQLNDYFAYRILRIVNIEAEHNKPIIHSARRLRRHFRKTRLLDHVSLKGLPAGAAVSLALLKMGLFDSLLLSLRAYNAAKQTGRFCSRLIMRRIHVIRR